MVKNRVAENGTQSRLIYKTLLMRNINLTSIEKEITAFDFSTLETHLKSAKANIAGAKTAAEIGKEICSIWQKIRKFVVLAENIPFVGKYITILVELLDSICPS